MNGEVEIIGRQSSHYTRMVRVFAAELGVSHAFTPVQELMSRDREVFAGNPALKLPILRDAGETIYGSMNICRRLCTRSGGDARVFWPEEADSELLMNAHEIVAHAMTAEVDVVIHEVVEKRPPDNASMKRRESLVGCLQWLDRHLGAIMAEAPTRDVSLFEIQLYCLLSHLPFRRTTDIAGMFDLEAFKTRFGERKSAKATPYRFDRA